MSYCLMQTDMDVNKEETVATDDDSREADESFYLSRLMLTGYQLSSPTLVSPEVLSEEISLQIGPQRYASQPVFHQTSAAEQIQGTVGQPANLVRAPAVLNEEESSTEREHGEVVNPSPTHGSTSDAPHLQPEPCLRRSLRISAMNSTQHRSMKESPDRKDYINGLNMGTCEKQTLLAKPLLTPGIIKQNTGRFLSARTIHRRNQFGETKLHLAVMREHMQDVKDLLTAGFSVNVTDYAGWTPLHEAVYRNNYDMTEILLEAGAIVNCRGDHGITPLHDAVRCQYYKIVDLLLRNGANPLLKSDGGKTALDMSTHMDSSLDVLVEKYLQNPKIDPSTAENTPRTTNSTFNQNMSKLNNKNSVTDSGDPLQKSTVRGTADTSEHESSLQSCEAEPIPGPSSGQPNCDPSTFQALFKAEPSPQTSSNVLCLVRDQGQDFCSQSLSLVQDQENEGSDSDVTMDYIEDNSSSPDHWTLCATQDFSGS